MKLKTGIIGLRMGKAHLEGYLQNPHTEVSGICDIDKVLLQEIREK